MRRWRIKTRRGTLDVGRFVASIAYFCGFLRAHWLALGLALMATLAGTLLSLASPWPVQVVLDSVILQKQKAVHWLSPWIKHHLDSSHLLWCACAAVVVIAILQGLAEYASQLLQANTAHRIGEKLRHRLFKHLQSLSLGFHQRHRTGDLLLRLTGDISMVRDMMVESLFELATSAIMVTALVIFMFRLSAPLTWTAISTVPVVLAASMLASTRLRAAVRKKREKEGDLISTAGEILSSISVVQALTREDAEKERLSRMGRSSLRAGLKTVRLESRLARSVQIVTALGMCGILYLGVGEVQADRLSPGTLIVFISYFNSLLKPIRQVARVAGRLAKASSCADRIRDVLQTRPEICDRADAAVAKSFDGRLSVEQVTFQYGEGTPALADISLDLAPGECVALVGPTGAGKSTIVKLLMRFYDPQKGCIRIDGRDIRDYTVESLRRQISFVPQETTLFRMTVAENIAMGREGATREDVERAAARLDLHDWIQSLPNGYDTMVGERGMTLSGGQRQLIALARAVLRDGRILIFDEPTSGLDGRTEARIRTALQRARAGRTTLIISHRLRPITDVGRVVVVEGGRLVQDGQHEALSQDAGVYREMFGAAALAEAGA